MIEVNAKSSIAIYEQIEFKIKELILKNALKEGEKLPSVRELACIITVNPNTISKSYYRLEQNGYLESIKGKGTFVKKGSHELVKKELMINFEYDMEQLMKKAIDLEMTYEKLIDMQKEVYMKIGGYSSDRN